MKIIPSRLSNGQRIPVLFYLTPSQPVLVPFLFVALKRRYKAFNTIRNDLVAIKAFYEFHALHNIDADEALIAGKIEFLIKNLEQFLAWLSMSKQASNIVGRIGNNKLGDLPGIRPITRDGHLKSLKIFLIWCSQRYARSMVANDIESTCSSYSSLIASRFDSYLLMPASRGVDFRSFNDDDVAAIREFSHPASLLNPFRKKNRLRNWLIIETFFETGIRIGEMLMLTTTSINRGSISYYLSVINPKHAGNDTRTNIPSLKTAKSERTIGISEALYEKIKWYVIHERRPQRDSKPMTLKHGYLWVSERGNPLAINSVASLFCKLIEAIQRKYPKLLKSASPHSFRHTFAEQFLRYLIEVKNLDMERATDELRTICGWTESSKMPQYYSRRYIHNLANRHNTERVDAAWSRLNEHGPFFP